MPLFNFVCLLFAFERIIALNSSRATADMVYSIFIVYLSLVQFYTEGASSVEVLKLTTVEHFCCCRSYVAYSNYACFFLTILTYILCLLSDVTSYPDSVASHSQSGYPNRKVHVFSFFQIHMKCREHLYSLLDWAYACYRSPVWVSNS